MEGEQVNISNIEKKFPNLIIDSKEEFLEFYGREILNNPHSGQFFYGWFFSIFTLKDGKGMVCLIQECLELNKEEKLLLNNVQNGIPGYFRILKIEDKNFYLEDLLTKKDYLVKTRDLEHKLIPGKIVEVCLVKNLKGDYFFFGGLRTGDKTRLIELNLAGYSRDLNVDEMVEREILIMKNMDEEMLIDYLEEVLDFNDDEIGGYFDLSEKEREEMIREHIIMLMGCETGEENGEGLWENKTKINGVWVDDKTGEGKE